MIVAALIGSALIGQGQVAAQPASKGRTYLSVDPGPAFSTKSQAGAPVLSAITARYGVTMPDGRKVDIQPEFHFTAPLGNAVVLRRVMVETDSAFRPSDMRDAPVHVPPEIQKQGAVIRGGWPCGGGRYHVTLLAWLEDATGQHSNALRYTIHCNELLLN